MSNGRLLSPHPTPSADHKHFMNVPCSCSQDTCPPPARPNQRGKAAFLSQDYHPAPCQRGSEDQRRVRTRREIPEPAPATHPPSPRSARDGLELQEATGQQSTRDQQLGKGHFGSRRKLCLRGEVELTAFAQQKTGEGQGRPGSTAPCRGKQRSQARWTLAELSAKGICVQGQNQNQLVGLRPRCPRSARWPPGVALLRVVTPRSFQHQPPLRRH